jgi:uncharacterized protein YmfQ (DUF2313 family)
LDKSELFNLMPEYYRKSKVIDNVNTVHSIELTNYLTQINNTLNQFFLDSADTTLNRWEAEVGIQVDNTYNIDYRRSNTKAKLRGKGTVTIKMIENVAEAYSNGDVDIIENSSNYSFAVKFRGSYGIPPNIEDLRKAIEEIKPAHLAFDFEYTYMTFNEFDNYNKTWNAWDTLNLTWDEFEVYNI